MNIKLLAEAANRKYRYFTGWGISFFIDDDTVFDTFRSGRRILKSINKNNINILSIRHIIISHDHRDHTGGLWEILNANSEITVYICPTFSKKTKYRIKKTHTVVEVSGPTMIKKNIFLTGEINGKNDKTNIPEQALVIKEKNALTVITGCAHPGIINILKQIKENFSEPIELVAGGFHLIQQSDDNIKSIIAGFRELGVKKVAPLHCSGKKAMKFFSEEYKENYIEKDNFTQLTCQDD